MFPNPLHFCTQGGSPHAFASADGPRASSQVLWQVRGALMKIADEVRHKSEDVNDAVLIDAARALHRLIRVSHDFDVPYIAG
jgi:hypothetical protein